MNNKKNELQARSNRGNKMFSVFSYSSSKPGSLEGIRWQSIERRLKKRDNEKAI